MFPRRRRLRLGGVAAIAAAALLAAGCGSSGGSSTSSSSGATAKGGTATFAELPQSTPNWIWPFMPITNYSVANSQQFQWLMYRPLYMFGNNGQSISANYAISPANAPVYSNGGKTVTITMKGWKWSNGETVDASDVLFWMHMLQAEKANFAGFSPGLLPDNMASVSGSGNKVVMQLKQPYSSIWFTYNQLAIITPMPSAWDVTSLKAKAGSGGCATDSAADNFAKCKAVFNFLTAQTKATSTYVSSPIWSVVDGPWKMTHFDTAGHVTFVPNTSYSGSPKPSLSQFKLVPFTDDATEYTALKTGQLSVGYIPAADLPQKPANSAVPATDPTGQNLTLSPNYDYGVAYYQPNFNNPTFGAVFKQLYARQALQMVSDQVGIDKAVYRGYSNPTSGGVPSVPTNQFVPSQQQLNGGQGPYPFDTTKAASLLTSHGWKMTNGVMVCQNAGTGASQCGAGIKAGTPFKFTLQYSTGQAAFTQETSVYKSDASKAGIDINLVGQSFNTIIGQAVPCKPTQPSCKWDALMYGLWVYNGPGFEPTGEPLFQTGAGSNSGSYSNAQMDKLINLTHTSSSLTVFHNYANFVAQQLPYIWMPLSYNVQGVDSKLHNVTFNSLQTLLPEYWAFSK
jgi:peptide/nickel transport system substrate-binding protein